jgi:hypothetical protein
MLVLLRPSSEALLRARAPGAGDQHGCWSNLSISANTTDSWRRSDRRTGCAAGLFQQQDFEIDQAEPEAVGRWLGGNVECRQEQESC